MLQLLRDAREYAYDQSPFDNKLKTENRLWHWNGKTTCTCPPRFTYFLNIKLHSHPPVGPWLLIWASLYSWASFIPEEHSTSTTCDKLGWGWLPWYQETDTKKNTANDIYRVQNSCDNPIYFFLTTEEYKQAKTIFQLIPSASKPSQPGPMSLQAPAQPG